MLATFIGFLAVCGVGYFCMDSYRHRQRTASQLLIPDASSDAIYDCLGPLDAHDLHAAEQTVNCLGHGVDEVSHGAITHSVEVISHTLSHY